MLCFSLWGQTAKIQQLEAKRKKALTDIENTNKLLINTKRVTQNLLVRINLIVNQIESRKQIITLLGQEADALAVQQAITGKEIAKLQQELAAKQKNYKKAIEGMIYRKQSENKLLYILSGKSLAESMRRMRYLKEYSEWRSKQADEIKAKAEQLRQKKADLEQQRKSKILLLSQKVNEQQNLKNEETTHQQEASEAQQKQKELQTILANKRKQADQLNAQIENLIAAEVARQKQEEERKEAERQKQLAAQEQARKAVEEKKPKLKKEKRKNSKSTDEEAIPAKTETIEKPVMRASSANTQLSNSFAANKGRLPIPVTGRYSIVTGFGEHQQSKYVTTASNGIDIQTDNGSDARATFNGEVTKVMAFPGYNNCIIIRHGNYYTFYGNISSLYVHQGQSVKTGQSLGKIFTDPDTGVTKMQFQLWNGTTKQNPMSWLGR